MNWTLRRMKAPRKKWSMNEPWLGARIKAPLGGTLSLEIVRARKNASAQMPVRTRTTSWTQSGSFVRARSWNSVKCSAGRSSLPPLPIDASCSLRFILAIRSPYPRAHPPARSTARRHCEINASRSSSPMRGS